MLHWTRPAPVAFSGAAPPADPPQAASPRAQHARMLARAATGRRAAVASLRNQCRVDALYWKSWAPQALLRARALRALGLSSLP